MKCIRLCALSVLIAIISACNVQATPIVIRDNSAAQTRTAAVLPIATQSGSTATPYTRPTDDPALDLDTPIVQVGGETITLGQYHKRVRYERFFVLDSARRLVERIGLERLLQTPLRDNPTLTIVVNMLNDVIDTNAFGEDVFDAMLRESAIRHEFNARKMEIPERQVEAYWIRLLELQDAPQLLPSTQEEFITKAMNYSGMTRDEVMNVVQINLMTEILRPLIISDSEILPDVLQFKLRRLVVVTQADADAALARVKGGEDFRKVACEVSIDSAIHGQQANQTYVTKGQFVAGIQNVDAVFEAAKGDIVGPLQSPLGWHVFLIKDQRKNADGDTEILVQGILVLTESLATEVKERAEKGDDFDLLACIYSVENVAGIGGDMGNLNPDTLQPHIAQAVRESQTNDVLGPFKTEQGYEVFLVENRQMQVLKPEELEKARQQTFVNWQISKTSGDNVQLISDSWQNAVPVDPAPEDVSPLLRTDHYGTLLKRPTATPAP